MWPTVSEFLADASHFHGLMVPLITVDQVLKPLKLHGTNNSQVASDRSKDNNTVFTAPPPKKKEKKKKGKSAPILQRNHMN